MALAVHRVASCSQAPKHDGWGAESTLQDQGRQPCKDATRSSMLSSRGCKVWQSLSPLSSTMSSGGKSKWTKKTNGSETKKGGVLFMLFHWMTVSTVQSMEDTNGVAALLILRTRIPRTWTSSGHKKRGKTPGTETSPQCGVNMNKISIANRLIVGMPLVTTRQLWSYCFQSTDQFSFAA